MGCSSSAQGSRDNVRARQPESSEKDKPQASIKPTTRQEEEKIQQNQNKANLDVKSAQTNGSSPAGQNKSTNPNSVTTAASPIRKPVGPNVLPKLPCVAENTRYLLHGKFGSVGPQNVKPNLIRFYHCACVSDSINERKTLLHGAYGKLQHQCIESGFHLEVTDLNWKCSVQLKHQVSQMYQKEMQACRDTAFKTFFVIFLNDKYGSECPPFIEFSDFETVLSSLSEEDGALLNQFYKQDLNASPSVYRLQTPLEMDLDENSWQGKSERLLMVLQLNFSQDKGNQYLYSDFDRSITQGILDQGIPASNIILVTRKFTGTPDDNSLPELKDYKNILCDEVDTIADDRLKDLRSRIEAKTVSDNVVKFETAWADSVGVSDDDYLRGVDEKFGEIGTKLVAEAIKEKLESDKNLSGIATPLFKELQQQLCRTQTLNQSFQGRSDILTKLCNYLADGHVTKAGNDKRCPLVICGESGIGKTAICSVLNNTWQTVPGWEMGVCAARFVGATSLPKTMLAVLQSICLQIDTAYGLGLSKYSKNTNQLCLALKELFATQPPQHPLLVIIDGIDHLIDFELSTLSWLPQELPSNVRIILTATNRELLKSKIADEDYFLEVPPLNADECSAILGNVLTTNKRTLTAEQKEDISTKVKAVGTPLYNCLVSATACDLTSYDSPSSECELKGNMKEQVTAFVERLEKLYSREIVSCVLSCLYCAKTGLSNDEIVDVIFCDNSIQDKENETLRTIWPTLCHKMAPLIMCHSVQNSCVCIIESQIVKDVISERYASKLQSAKEMLLKYFTGELQHTNGGCVSPNRRCAEEFHLLIQSGELKKAKELLFDYGWLSQELICAGVFDLLGDIKSLIHHDANCKELALLHSTLSSSAISLSSHPHHLPLKLYSQLKSSIESGNYPLLKNLCSNLTGSFLVPSCELMTELGNKKPSEELTKPIITGIFRIPSHPKHVVSVATEKGEICVWDYGSRQLVRRLTGISMPRNIKMVDFAKAAALCNRELKIYNLDTGTLQAKMKGVLHVKMPFYGIHDADHVVALSRNRMYVNIMNMNTSDMAATFKVGEDRFLNSLLVSQNGESCVCGDEVQKPFPLLVWDLPKRKLVHDFRIAGHEFLTNMSAITNDGHYVVCVCKELDDPAPNFLIVYDIQSGQLFKKWKPDYNTTAIAISSESSVVVSACEDSTIMVWDMIAGSLRHELTGHSMPVDTIKLSDDGLRCITHDSSGKDTTIHQWDVTSGECVGVFSPDEPISCCEITSDGSMVLVAIPGQEDVLALQCCEAGADWKLEGASSYGDESLRGETFDLSQAG